jgi:hypothetical protein
MNDDDAIYGNDNKDNHDDKWSTDANCERRVMMKDIIMIFYLILLHSGPLVGSRPVVLYFPGLKIHSHQI